MQHLNKQLPTVFDFFVRRFIPNALQTKDYLRRRADNYLMMDLGYDSVQDVPYMTGRFMLFRKTMLDRIEGFDSNMFMHMEDTDITMRVNQISRACYFPDASITHEWSRASHKSFKLMVYMVRSMVYFFGKWGWKWF